MILRTIIQNCKKYSTSGQSCFVQSHMNTTYGFNNLFHYYVQLTLSSFVFYITAFSTTNTNFMGIPYGALLNIFKNFTRKLF